MSSWFIRRANVVYSAGGRLPAGFAELEYIQSSGIQWIDTGIVPDFNTEVSIKAAIIDWHIQYGVLAGARTSGDNAGRYIVFGYNSSTEDRTVLSGSSVAFARKHAFGTAFDIVFNESGTHRVLIDNSLVTTFSTGNTLSQQNPLLLFGISGYGTDHYLSSAKVFGLKIKQGGVLVMDLVPAMRKSDKEVGMYNLVNDTFFTNAGTGQFGYKIKDFPNGYTQLAYIESNGNPYINTGITYAADREITCDFLYSKFIAYVAIFSNYVDEGSNIIRCILGASSGSIFPQFNSKASATSAVSCAISKNHSITMKTGNAILDGTSRSISTTQGTENNTSIVLFRSKVGGNAYDIGARIYSFVVRDSGTKVMELVPAKRNSDNEVGMYDLVSGSFLTNIGTGTFGYGEL